MSVILEGILQASVIVSIGVIILSVIFRKKYDRLSSDAVLWTWRILGIRLCILYPFVYKIFGFNTVSFNPIGENPVYFSVAELMPETKFYHYFSAFLIGQNLLWLFVIWAAGTLVFLSIHCIRFDAAMRKMKNGSSRISNLYDFSCGYGLKCSFKCRKVEVRSCAALKSPMLMGFYRKYLFVPEKLPEDSDMQMILKHEMLHYQRKDILLKQFMLVCNAIHWFNPIIYWMRRKTTEITELACDYEVVKDFDAEDRQSYAELLYYTLQSPLKGTGVSSVMLSSKAKVMAKRFNNILSTKRRKHGIFMFSVILAVLVILQSFLYLDIRADAFQFSYIEIQRNVGESSYIETIPLADLYFLNENQKLERMGDYDELVLKPGQELQLYLSDEGEMVKLEKGDVVHVKFEAEGDSNFYFKLDRFRKKLTFSNIGETFYIKDYIEGTIKLLNSSYERCIIS